MKNSRLAICVTTHFSADRVKYLKTISDHFATLSDVVDVFIVTNARANQGEIELLDEVLKNKGFNYEFFVPYGLGHPYFLTWSHFDVFKKLVPDESITHYMYIEDDLLLTKDNIDYWNESLETLEPLGLIPSFLRVEQNANDSRWYSSDAQKKFHLSELPKVNKDKNYAFINCPDPYQGMYLLTRDLMIEHLNSPSSHPDFGYWYIRERAAQGLTYQNVPKWCTSRNFAGYNTKMKKFDERCLVHHLPDSYANRTPPAGKLGTIPIDELVLVPSIRLTPRKHLRNLIKKIWS